ncbi:unnamed protein product [Diamesa serratosioi]
MELSLIQLVIKIEILEPTFVLSLHNDGLEVTDVKVIDKSGSELKNSFKMDGYFMITIEDAVLMTGTEYTLDITFKGLLRTGTSGFYRTYYQVNGNTTRRYLAATQFENFGARMTFPCYDEPALKAIFNVKMTHDASYNTIANTIGTRVENADKTVTTTFPASPVMSSYLLAFVVSDFEYTTMTDVDGRLHRIYTHGDSVARTNYALANSPKLLKALEDYVSIDYELPKAYHAAIPDFGAGAMENWGLITYKEQYLIVDSNSHHREVLDSVRVMAHELGHMFFGNLVTCDWWNYIWLNEGFATLFEYQLTDAVYPTMRMRDYFNLKMAMIAFEVDALPTTTPMTTVDSPDTSSNSLIIYNKAGSVLRMFQYTVGNEIFKNTLNEYLTTNEHKPVKSTDLYNAFQKTFDAAGFTDFNFADAFKTWELQKGYPVIHVKYNTTRKSFEITQRRYLTTPDDTDKSTWFIPLNYATADKPNFENTTITDYFMPEEPIKLVPTSADFNSNNWFIFNKQGLGFYRVNYEFDNWHQIIITLNSRNYQNINVINRAQLLDDAFHFAADGYLDFDVLLGLVQYLHRETDYLPWAVATTGLNKLDVQLQGTPAHHNFKRFVHHLVQRMYANYGFVENTNDTIFDHFGRELAITWLCKLGDLECHLYTNTQVALFQESGKTFSKSVEVAVICGGVRGIYSKQTDWIALFNVLLASTDQALRLRFIDGLGCSEDSNILKTYLESTVDASNVNYRQHEKSRLLSVVYTSSTTGLVAALDFISEFHDEIVSSYAIGSVNSILIAISKRIVIQEHETKLMSVIDKLSSKLQANIKTVVMTNINDNKQWQLSEKFTTIDSFIENALNRLDADENKLRLGTTSMPNSYKLVLQTNVDSGSRLYSGDVSIELTIMENTETIMLHSKEQTINDLKVFEIDGVTPVPLIKYSLYSLTDTLTVYFMNEAVAGSVYILKISYSAVLGIGSAGFYRTEYKINNETRYLAATQFEPARARFAFPCYDEPAFKASFELSIIHQESYHAISNMDGIRTVNTDATITTKFEKTPVMSTYLLAFVVSDFEFISNAATKMDNETLHRIYVRSDAIEHTKYALENSEKFLKALENYVSFDYELSKVDSAAIPFKGGAMENWGLITYRENILIYDVPEDEINHVQKFDGISTIAHELAHQFFGNLVTCEWWSYSWLNEGFATLFENILVDAVYPQWRMTDLFNVKSLHAAFNYDSMDNTRAMTSDMETLTDISSAFDATAYVKSGSVLRMFQHTVGEEIFRDALHIYLTKNEHKAINSEPLYQAFQESFDSHNFTAFNFADSFKTWELQEGFPVIHVQYNDTINSFLITQNRFLEKSVNNARSSWHIPLNFATADSPDFDNTAISDYFKTSDDIKTVPALINFDASQWYIFNKQQLGYYRVNYDFANWHMLLVTLSSENYKDIHVLNRAQIMMDDAMNLAVEGNMDYDLVFNLISYLDNETDYLPWTSATKNLELLDNLLAETEAHEYFRMLMQELSESYVDFLGFSDVENEMIEDKFGRNNAINFACSMGSQGCLNKSLEMLEAHINGTETIPVNLQSTVFCNGLRAAAADDSKDASLMEALWESMQQSDNTEYRLRIIDILGCHNNAKDLKDLLETTLATVSNEVRYLIPERFRILQSVYSKSSVGVEVTIDFMIEHSSTVLRLFQTNDLAQTLITSLSTKIAEQNLFEKVKFYVKLIEIINTSLNPEATSTAVLKVLSNLTWQEKNSKNILNWLQKYFKVPIDETTNAPETSDNPLTTQVSTESSTTVETTTPGAALGIGSYVLATEHYLNQTLADVIFTNSKTVMILILDYNPDDTYQISFPGKSSVLFQMKRTFLGNCEALKVPDRFDVATDNITLNFINEQTTLESFLLFWNLQEEVDYIIYGPLDLLKSVLICLTNSLGSFLIIITNDYELFMEDEITQFLTTTWIRNGAFKVYVYINSKIYSYNPFDVGENGTFGSLKVNTKYHIPKNFHNYPMNIEIFTSTFTLFQSEKCSLKEPITCTIEDFGGPDAEVAKFISEQMNTRMNIIENDGTKFGFKTANGSLSGTLKTLQQRTSDLGFTGYFIKDYNTRDVDFTCGVYSDSLCVVVKKAERIPQFLLPLVIFEDTLWFTLFAMTLLSFFFWCFLRMVHNQRMPNLQTKMIKFNVPSHLLLKFNIENYHMSTYLARQSSLCQYTQLFVDLLMLMVQAPMRRLPRMQSERVFICSICLLSIVIVSMYQSGMSTVFFKPFYFKDINTLESLDKSGIQIQVKYLGYMSDVFPNDSSSIYHHLKRKMKFTETTKSMMTLVRDSDDKIATITRKSTVSLDNSVYFTKKQLHLIPECPKIYNLGYMTAKSSVYLERINQILLDIQRYGLMEKWIKDINFMTTLQYIRDFDEDNINVKILSMKDLQFPFFLLFFGCTSSFGMWVVEILMNHCWHKCSNI